MLNRLFIGICGLVGRREAQRGKFDLVHQGLGESGAKFIAELISI